ncbi:glycosyltransferase family 2 protein [Paenibacillus sp. KS-LC4]|uniref:glycosyltransferase family 2 protein n=1 Tax=Paenibacillus sp. KS-LC4 TaxID=2979727 RepID=UPI0030D33C9C
MLTSIIIPTYNRLPLLQEAIYSIRSSTPEQYELIIVDNGSTDGTIEYLREQQITFIGLPSNQGFPAACNWGLRLARGDQLLLLNNDVLVAPGWLGKLRQALGSSKQIGIAGPMSNFVSGKQQIEMRGNYVEMAEQLAAEYAGDYEEVSRLVGFCLLFSRELMDQIGLLDERFSPGHYEDDDYCYRARQAGYRLLMAKDTFVFHHGSASFKQEGQEAVERLLARNRMLFTDKWGVDPQQFI